MLKGIIMIGLGWFSALSTLGKVGVVSAAVVTTGIAANTTSGSTPSTTPTTPVSTCVASVSFASEKEPVAFNKTTTNDSSIEIGKKVVETKGKDGERTKTWKITNYSPENCKPSARTLEKEVVTISPTDEVVLVGTKEKAVATPPVSQPNNCDPNYTPCVPNVPYDLDCADIGISVRVIGSDPHNFDADGDGYGCESY